MLDIPFVFASSTLCSHQLDQRLVSQFDRIQGFACIASRMCDFSGDSEPVVDALLSLLFWRMGKRGNIIAEKPQSKGSTTSAMFHKLDVIDEVCVHFFCLVV